MTNLCQYESRLGVFYVQNMLMLYPLIMFNFCMLILCLKSVKHTSQYFR